MAPVASRGVDQAAELGGGGVDELDEPGASGQPVPFADEDGEQVQDLVAGRPEWALSPSTCLLDPLDAADTNGVRS